MRISYSIALYILIVSAVYADYGDLYNGYPSHKEREAIVMTNAVRMAPQEFRNLYISDAPYILQESIYPSVAPLYWRYELNLAARQHSVDMADNCGMQHNSCDSTLWYERLWSVYPEAGYIAENVATGRDYGWSTIIQWLRDEVNGDPAEDSTDYDGHRKNIMNPVYNEVGVGYGYSETRLWYDFWTQDFSDNTNAFHKVPAASHMYELVEDSVVFMANYYDDSELAPQNAEVIVNTESHAMSLHLGEAAKGTYTWSALGDSSDCFDYYFLFRDAAGMEWRYPETENLKTHPEQECDVPVVVQKTGQMYSKGWTIVRKKDHLLVRLSTGNTGERLNLYDLQGNLVASQFLENGEAQFSLMQFPVGVYRIYSTDASLNQAVFLSGYE
jgi:hypothetical protein